MSRLVSSLALLLALGCASGPFASDAEARRTEIEQRVIALEKEATKAKLELERVRRRLAELEAGATTSAPEIAPAPPAAPPPVLSESPTATPPAPLVPSSALEESELEEPASTSGGRPTAGAEAERYERALALLGQGQAAEAEAQFSAFVADYPASDLTDNAWFWIGESRLVRQDLAGATAAYRTAIETHPEGNKTPDALFKLGHCLSVQGDAEAAREVWSELIRRFPATAAADRARGALGTD